MNGPSDYVTDGEPEIESGDSGARPVVVQRIKEALVTSRLTFGSQSTGTNPYDSGGERRNAGSMWGNRLR